MKNSYKNTLNMKHEALLKEELSLVCDFMGEDYAYAPGFATEYIHNLTTRFS